MASAPAGREGEAEEMRFAQCSEEDIVKILEEKDSLSTKRATKCALMCLQQYLLATNRELNLDTYCASEVTLAAMLVNFYADARKKTGEKYKLSALKSIRFGLARHFSTEYNIDIIKDQTFKRANDVFQAVCVGLKRVGLGKVDHTPPIEETDLQKIYYSAAMNTKTPVGLQQKTWFDIMYFLCRRGRENLRQMKKDTFKISTDSQGREYVYQHTDELDKNHRENVDPNQSVTEGRMYAVPGHPLCPVKSFREYISRLRPSNEWLWQRPVDSFHDDMQFWYTNQVLGKNTLAVMMKNICKLSGLEREFNNHSIRATSITVLDINKFSNRDIMSVSGHRSESSLKTYTSRVSSKRKHEMSVALTEAVIPEVSEYTCIPEESSKNNNIVANTESEIVCDGVINMTQAEIQQLMEPMNMEEVQVAREVRNVNVQSQAQSERSELSEITNFMKCVNNNNNSLGFMPYITGCVVNFNINRSK